MVAILPIVGALLLLPASVFSQTDIGSLVESDYALDASWEAPRIKATISALTTRVPFSYQDSVFANPDVTITPLSAVKSAQGVWNITVHVEIDGQHWKQRCFRG